MLSQTSLHATRALAYLVEHRYEEPILARLIGEATGIPRNYLSKIMHSLGAAGILSAERGKNGGYRFARDPSEIRLVEVVDLFQNTAQFRQCLLVRPRCSDEHPCRIHRRWKPVADTLIRFLEETSIADLNSADGARRTPQPV